MSTQIEAPREEKRILTYYCDKCGQPVRFTANVKIVGDGVTYNGRLTPLDRMDCSQGGEHYFGAKLGH